MNRQYRCACCAVILLFCSCEPFAQDEPQDIGEADPNEAIRAVEPNETIRTVDPNEAIKVADPNEAIRTLVRSYLEACEQVQRGEVLALRYFHSDEERQAFEKTLVRIGRGASPWDLRKEIHLVRFRRKGDDIQAMLLLPYRAEYLPTSFAIRAVREQLMIVQEKTANDRNEHLDPVQASIANVQETLEGWKTASGAALSEKCLAFREQLKEEIEVLEYAQTNELPIYSGYGGLTERLKVYEEVRSLSDDELQAKMIKEIQDVLERISK